MKRATIEDVAELAGVSRQTVSRAINNKPEINAETRERVMQAVVTLGYRPNRIAQSMVTNRTHSIGLLIADITNPFFPEVTRGIQDIAQASSYNVFVCNCDDQADLEIQELHSLAAQGVDGIIVFSHNASDNQVYQFAKSYAPLVFVNRQLQHQNLSVLMINNFHGAELAAARFLELGRTNIGMVTNNSSSYKTSRRLQGFRQYLKSQNIPLPEERIISADTNLEGGYSATCELLEKFPTTNAVFAYNDLMAIGAMRACQEKGRRIPQDVAIIGFDDIQFSRMITPALTTVRVDKYAVGKMAVTRLMEMIADPSAEYAPLELQLELVLRETA